MKNTMIRRLLAGILGTAALAAGAADPVIDLSAKTEKIVAFQEPGKFCGWPANEGIWSWGDEILVGFELRDYLKSSKTHSADYSKPGRCVLARSLDGGRSWKLETPEAFNRPEYIGDASRNDRQERPPRKLTEPLDFRAPGFAMKLRGTMFYTSADRGRNWDGPFRLEIAGVDRLLMSRTDYIVEGPRSCMIFTSALKSDGKSGRSLAARTDDGGLSWKLVAWLTDEPELGVKNSFSIMPSTVKLPDGTFVTALRERRNRKKWIDIRRSEDGGRTWDKVATPSEMAWNPPSLIRLADGRLCLTYCDRRKPYSLRARLSGDGGRSWGPVLILRQDAASWDMGYVRSVQRPDGKVVTLCYYTTAELEPQHIAATIWNPEEL